MIAGTLQAAGAVQKNRRKCEKRDPTSNVIPGDNQVYFMQLFRRFQENRHRLLIP